MSKFKFSPVALAAVCSAFVATSASAELAAPTPKYVYGGLENWPAEVAFPADSRWVDARGGGIGGAIPKEPSIQPSAQNDSTPSAPKAPEATPKAPEPFPKPSQAQPTKPWYAHFKHDVKALTSQGKWYYAFINKQGTSAYLLESGANGDGVAAPIQGTGTPWNPELLTELYYGMNADPGNPKGGFLWLSAQFPALNGSGKSKVRVVGAEEDAVFGGTGLPNGCNGRFEIGPIGKGAANASPEDWYFRLVGESCSFAEEGASLWEINPSTMHVYSD